MGAQRRRRPRSQAVGQPSSTTAIYRAVVAARAQAALALGVVHLHRDCTEMSRPILSAAGWSR
ncbi:hypothetical protein [Nocardioides dongkuii]|uniref:hypothetical protein n=1 Tax=Nocardioides dongkuii TaxID=2760089 RepID=UPI0015FBEC2F|nr:hypothetical protein [Nocardioides dongkuii]